MQSRVQYVYIVEHELFGAYLGMFAVANYFAGVLDNERKFFYFMFGFDLLPYTDSHIQNDYTGRYRIHPRSGYKQQGDENNRHGIAEIEYVFENYPRIRLGAVDRFVVCELVARTLRNLRFRESFVDIGIEPFRMFELMAVLADVRSFFAVDETFESR